MYDAWRAADLQPKLTAQPLVEHIGGVSRVQALQAWFRRRRTALHTHAELLRLGSQDLAELGLTAGDIPFVSRENFRGAR